MYVVFLPVVFILVSNQVTAQVSETLTIERQQNQFLTDPEQKYDLHLSFPSHPDEGINKQRAERIDELIQSILDEEYGINNSIEIDTRTLYTLGQAEQSVALLEKEQISCRSVTLRFASPNV